MTFYEFVINIGIEKFIISLILLLLIVVILLMLVLKMFTGMSLKFGKLDLNLNNKTQKNEIINLVFDFGEFQNSINESKNYAIDILHKQAKRYTKLQLFQYIQRLKNEVSIALANDYSENKILFNLFLNDIKSSMFSYLMDIYEKNHLSNKTDAELAILAKDHYEKLTDLFKEHASSVWSLSDTPYLEIKKVSKSIQPFVEDIAINILTYYRKQSRERIEIDNAVRKITIYIKNEVSKNLKLPEDACFIASQFFSESEGLNHTLINDFIKEN